MSEKPTYEELEQRIQELKKTEFELKRAEKELLESEDRYRAVVEDMPVLICSFLPGGKITFVNKTYCEYFDKTSEGLVGSNFLSSIPEVHRQAVMTNISALTVESPTQSHEHPVITPSGDVRWQRWTNRALFDAQGKVVGYHSLGEDITEHKRAEEVLRESEEKYRTLVEGVPDLIYSYSTIRGGIYYSQNVQSVLGYSESHLLQNPQLWHNSIHPEDIHRVDAAIKDFQCGKPFEIEYRMRDEKGNWLWFFDRSIGRKQEDDEIIIEGIATDITERKRTEEEKARIEIQYRQAQKVEAIGRLAGGVAHDLNNMLSPIIGYSELLIDDFSPNDKRREFLNQIIRAAYGTRDLVRQLLAFSRKQTLEYKPLNLNKTIMGFENLMRRTIREDIELEIIPSPDIKIVQADIGQIEQVIMNLSVNAQDAMPDGGKLTLKTAMIDIDENYVADHPETEAGRYVMLAVSDTGCGMDEETLENIFEPFFSTKGEQGTGLGLATVYGIIKQHGGNIWVYSDPGKGTTFKVYLPVLEENLVEIKVDETINTELKGSETILIVEDNKQVRDLANAILKQQGYALLVAGNGTEALKVLASHNAPVDLLLTDVVMPDMNGRDLYTKVTEKYSDIRVLYMSGYTGNVIAHRGVLEEGVQFIQKPFTVHGLTTKIREILEKN